jgi:hypothetical protein
MPIEQAKAAPSRKFQDPHVTASGDARATAPFVSLRTLWVNTGTLCNIECARCYIASSPTNDRLAYFTAAELRPFLAEAFALGANEIGFTGGEPFMNPEIGEMLGDSLDAGFSVLVLTNAMRPMMRPRVQTILKGLREKHGRKLSLRVSLDHYAAEGHNEERGAGSFNEALSGLIWLGQNGFRIAVAGRKLWGETDIVAREGFASLFAASGLDLDAHDPHALVLFPEMDEHADALEITTSCWDILKKDPASVMCSTSRMVAKRKGASRPAVLACTLIPYDPQFELGDGLAHSLRPVILNHPHCSKFCVLGGASCSP